MKKTYIQPEVEHFTILLEALAAGTADVNVDDYAGNGQGGTGLGNETGEGDDDDDPDAKFHNIWDAWD